MRKESFCSTRTPSVIHPRRPPAPANPLDSRPPAIHNGSMNTAPADPAIAAEIEASIGGMPPIDPSRTFQRLPGLAVAKVRYTHDAMIDMIIMDPAVSQGHLASVFGYSEAWVSLVMSSDAFKERLAARKSELIDPTIRATLNERFEAMTRRSLEVLSEKLSRPAHTVPDNLALKAAELGAKALGLGGNAPPPPQSGSRLDELAGRLLSFMPRPPATIDITPDEVQDAA